MASAGEEAAVIAQEFITSLDNVPSEVQFLLAEMRERECRINELQARIQPRSAQYIRHASKGVISEKDSQTLERIQADFKLISTLADEKVMMAKKLRDLLTKHSNRLKVELGRITNPAEFSGKPPHPSTLATIGVGTSTVTQPETLVYSGPSRTPITAVVATLKAETTTATTPAATAVPVVVEPPSAAASNASSPASAAPNKRRRLLSSQSNTSAQPAATPTASTPAAAAAATSRSSVPRNSTANASLTTAVTTTATPTSSRTRRAASANAANAAPAADPPPATRKMSESTSISTSTGGDDQDENMVDADSSAGEGEGDPGNDEEGDPGDDDGPYCVCQEKSYGEMIGCDNGADCPYQWFHVACVHVQKPLPATWFCDYCTKKLGYADNTGATAAPQQPSSSERAARKKRGR